MNSTTTIGQLHQAIARLSECDRVRLLQFAQALLVQKSGKRRQRQQRLARPVVEGWQVGQLD